MLLFFFSEQQQHIELANLNTNGSTAVSDHQHYGSSVADLHYGSSSTADQHYHPVADFISDITKESPSPVSARGDIRAEVAVERTTPKSTAEKYSSEVTTRKSRREYYEMEKQRSSRKSTRNSGGQTGESPDNLDSAAAIAASIPERQSPTSIPLPRHSLDHHPLIPTSQSQSAKDNGVGLYDHHRYLSPPPVAAIKEPTPRASKGDQRASVDSEVRFFYVNKNDYVLV